MSFAIIDVRELTDEERYYDDLIRHVEKAPDRWSRRQALHTIGGGALVTAFPSLLLSENAFAQRALVTAIFRGLILLSKGLYAQKEPVKATYKLVNQEQSRQSDNVYNAINTDGLGITAQDYLHVDLAPGTVTTLQHSGFEAEHIGNNKYLARTIKDSRSKGFAVG